VVVHVSDDDNLFHDFSGALDPILERLARDINTRLAAKHMCCCGPPP
jgi:hypothetical protein